MAADTNAPTWLHKLEEQVNVDVDAMDPDFIKALPIIPHDMTSNQIHVHGQMSEPKNRQLLLDVAHEYKGKSWVEIYTRAAVLLCKKNIDLISGRVLLQILPSYAYDSQKVLEHARLYAKEFESVGISKERFCIKIPSTGPALSVCSTLEAEGIRTLGTAVFSLAQAIAASQAECLYISPYFNEIRANFDLSLWPNVEDPATQHTMSARLIQMLETYRQLYKETGKTQPLIKNANFISPKEALAQGEFGVDSATVSAEVLMELVNLPYDASTRPSGLIDVPKPQYPAHQNTVSSTPERLAHLAGADLLAAVDWDGRLASTTVDYLEDNGAELEAARRADPIAAGRIRDALEVFLKVEGESKELIQGVMKEVAC
ncbi:uncharacterized protein DSM5745_02321 [Aspergillus mulundensis]|uniref:Transaldolase n=1 Tax=Aspergillus mulundensis TaxID=1810919 RepID=A0A3D8SW71_9EURO|nr:Uncharacterized protein DSM5745_02321 [Aspergillus mulundensis]RDW90546.1 Uncharacterized protein DSM5745_02321 [Aspergillus mulundensis]